MAAGKHVFAFFGHPGAGKSTLCRRLGEMFGVPALDTDAFMTPEEVAAVESGRYTQAMRLANIERYAARARQLLAEHQAIALADGLPNAAARDRLKALLPGVEVVFVLVQTPPASWRRRLSQRGENAVRVGIAEAEAYVRDHWQPLPPTFAHEVIENGEDAEAVNAALQALWRRHVAADTWSGPASPEPGHRRL